MTKQKFFGLNFRLYTILVPYLKLPELMYNAEIIGDGDLNHYFKCKLTSTTETRIVDIHFVDVKCSLDINERPNQSSIS